MTQLHNFQFLEPNRELYPVFAMILLTFLVNAAMMISRIIISMNINIQKFPTRSLAGPVFATVEKYGNNFQNLLEIPILFYVLSILLFVTRQFGDFYTYMSWAFVLGRYLHSIVHCTVNHVRIRAMLWLISTVVVYAMWFEFIRSALTDSSPYQR
jgi:hypothetical protein